MKYYLDEWEIVTNDNYVLQAIKGFKIPFTKVPQQSHEPSCPKMSKTEVDFISAEINEMLNIGAIQLSQEESDQFISNVFTVPKPDGKRRFVINLKALYEFVDSPHFKMEDIRCASSLLSRNCFMCVIDLKDAYYAIPIHKKHQKYLKFRWNGNLYQYTCLAFGLSIAPRLYTKILRPVFRYLRSQGYISNSYLDDSLLCGKTHQDCMSNLNATMKLLQPEHKVKYLGFYLDSSNMTISLIPSKRAKLIAKCDQIYKQVKIQLQDLAEFVGLLISAIPAVEYGQIYTRHLEFEKTKALVANNWNFSESIVLSNLAKGEIEWWMINLPSSNRLIRSDIYDCIITTDASLTGWVAECNFSETKGQWTETEKHMLIDELELTAIFHGLRSFVKTKMFHILCRTDNTTALSYINRFGGCRSMRCHNIAKEIWKWCQERQGFMTATYINTRDNVIADALSRSKKDESDFMLDKTQFLQICESFGIPEIDLFATHKTNQCKDFISFLPDPFSLWVDSFTYSWDGIFFYAFPPFNMITRVLNKIKQERSRGIVVAPYWPSQSWFPIFTTLVTSRIIYLQPNPSLLFCPYTNRNHHLARTVLSASPLKS